MEYGLLLHDGRQCETVEHFLGQLPPMLALQGDTLLQLHSRQGGDRPFRVDEVMPIEMHSDNVELALEAITRPGADLNGPADKLAAVLQPFEHELFGVVHRAL